jgi:hypothetical protein
MRAAISDAQPAPKNGRAMKWQKFGNKVNRWTVDWAVTCDACGAELSLK